MVSAESVRRSLQGLNFRSFGCVIQQCTDHGLVRQAKQLHARLILFSVTPGNFLASKLITFYAKSKHISEARKVFDEIPHRNVFSWNAMIIGYSSNGLFHHALKLFSSLSFSTSAQPDSVSITSVLKVLASSCYSPTFGKQIHGYVLRCGLDSNVFVLNALVTHYSKCDLLGFARTIFDRMPQRDIVSWNAMIAGYSQNGFYEECKQLYSEMLSSTRFNPDALTFVSVLQACAQSKDLIFGMEVHRLISETKIEMDVSLWNALIAMYAKCGNLGYALELFEEMGEKDAVTYASIISGYMLYGFIDKAMTLIREMRHPELSTWNAVISGLVQNNQHEQALDLVQEMLASRSRLNAITLSSILPAFSYFSNLRGGKEIHAYAIRRSFDKTIYVPTAIIDTYGKLGFLDGARRVFDQSECRSMVIWTAIISAYASHGDAGSAHNLYGQMLNSGVHPDHVTLTTVLAACAHSGQVDKAWEIFNTMSFKYGIQPLAEHYACMVDVLSRAGKLLEAADFISKMPVEPSARVWGALLHGASVYGNVEMGKFAFDHLFKIEPENTGNYIIMANLFSQAGRWEEADHVRGKLKETGLKKIRGSSWIETNGGLLSFIAKDVSNVRSDEIYSLLEGLLGLMREEGYIVQEVLDDESAFI